MRELVVTVRNATGLHARPAAILASGAKRFRSEIRAAHAGKQTDAKRAIALLALGVRAGGRIHIHVEGPDEEQAADALLRLTDGDWEGEPDADAAPPPASGPTPEALRSSGRILRGHPAAPGLAVGPAFRLFTSAPVPAPAATPSFEHERLRAALEAVREELLALRTHVRERAGDEGAALFEFHESLLEDAELRARARATIDAGRDAATAWRAALEPERTALEGLGTPSLSSRAEDLRDFAELVERRLLQPAIGDKRPETAGIVLAHELTPWDVARLDSTRTLGLCALRGGPRSHAAILARALGIPTVVGVEELPPEGTLAILDGDAGTLEIDPDLERIDRAKEGQRERLERRMAEAAAALDPAQTREGRPIEVLANLGFPADVPHALASGAEGVGLLRTEFLFMDRREPPSEEEQLAAYRDLVLALQGRTLTVRTFDAGADKPLAYLGACREDNPALGLRGIRLALLHPELLRTQLCAIARASEHGPIRVMFPMVTTLDEWRAARGWLERACRERGVAPLPCGPMIEVPAAALLAERFAPEADFFSIGTNDLTQYALAMDRMHPALMAAADGLHPAVLRLIRCAVNAGHAAGRRVGVCGELASELEALPILLGLGVDEVSVSPSAVPAVKARIRSLTLSSAESLAGRALLCATATEVRELAARA